MLQNNQQEIISQYWEEMPIGKPPGKKTNVIGRLSNLKEIPIDVIKAIIESKRQHYGYRETTD
jgi:hypothetical protein